MTATPAERRLAAQVAAHESWAQTIDTSARTAAARTAFLAKFEHQADPDGKLTPAERDRRAEHLRKAHFKRLALKSAQSRRRVKGAIEAAEAAEAELVSLGGDAE